VVVDDADRLDAAALARDIALYEQRGCLSPHAVYVVDAAERVAHLLATALESIAETWPRAGGAIAERARVRAFLDEAEWAGATVTAGAWGAVLLDPAEEFRPTCGHRTVRVHRVDGVDAMSARLPGGQIECIGATGRVPDDLRDLGVSRLCRIGDMQRPPLSWPRGGLPPLRSLVDPTVASMLEDLR
jgi:hypothetical protein